MPGFEGKFSPEDIATANSVARYVDLEGVKMLDGAFSLLSPHEPAPALAGASIMFESSYEHDTEKNMLSVRVKFSLTCKPSVLAQDESVFTARATFLLSYRLMVDPPPLEMRENLFQGFARVNGAFNAWPYLREFIQTSAARAGLSMMTLPVFRVPAPRRTIPTATPPTSAKPGSAGPRKATSRKKTAKT